MPAALSRALLVFGVLAANPAAAAELASAPVDSSLFRDGEVRHLATTVEDWTVVCDEVTRLRRRYCSLKQPVHDDRGAIAAWLTVSTGDDGRPAALLETPLGVRIRAGIIVERPPESCRHKKGRGVPGDTSCRRILAINECDSERCSAVWTLDDDELAALSAGTPMRLTYQRALVVYPLKSPIGAEPGATVVGVIATRGFASAVSASMH